MPNPAKKLKIGFIGCGNMGQIAHLENYCILPNVELTAITDVRAKTAEAVAKHYGFAHVYKDADELLAKSNVDAVVSVMGFTLHHNVIPSILKAGKHLLIEKPVGVNPANAREYVKIVRDNNVVFHVGYMKRSDLAARAMKAKIAEWRKSGEVGNMTYMRASMPPGDWTLGAFDIFPPINAGDENVQSSFVKEKFPAWMTEKQTRDYEGFVNFYVHQVNLIRYLLSEDYELTFADPKGMIFAARSASGVTIVLEMTTHWMAHEWHEQYRACFDRGYIDMLMPSPMSRQEVGKLEIYKNAADGVSYERPIFPPIWSFREQARIFVEESLGNMACISPAEDAAKDLEIAEDFVRMQNLP